MTTETKSPKPMGPTDCLTPFFRGSYVTLFEAKAPDPKKPNEKLYGVEMWFRVAEDCDERLKELPVVKLEDLEKAMFAACSGAWGKDSAAWPKGFKHPLKKGESLGGKNGPLKGGMIVRTTRKEEFGAPIVVDQNRKDIIDKRQAYSGAYYRAKLHAYTWKHSSGGQGVSFTLDMVQLWKDGEPLGNAMKAEDAFAALPVPQGSPAGAAAEPKTAEAAGGVFGNLG